MARSRSARGWAPFDPTFIDADKAHTPDYFAWALERSRPGSLIVAESRVSATKIQTVGGKGYDGFFYPVFPPQDNAGDVIAWLTSVARRRPDS